MLAVRVLVAAIVEVVTTVFEIVVVADGVFVLAVVAVPQEVCVSVLELLVEDV
jgi:hypothetical protein